MAQAPSRVLLVDDFERLRRFVGSMLRNEAQVQVVGEASDGLEAVQKAEELQPDLILLDLRLPKLNGIEAARLIREVAPKSKILFVSQEGSTVVVDAALMYARGYILKTDLATELLPGLAAVLRGEFFLSSSLAGHKRAASGRQFLPSGHHEVAFYGDDSSLIEGFMGCVQDGLKRGNAVVVVMTEAHRASLIKVLRPLGGHINTALEQGLITFLDIAEAVYAFTSNGTVDASGLRNFAARLIESVAMRDENGIYKVAVCGEGTSSLVAGGKAEAALEVESVWNEISKQYGVRVFCGYLCEDGIESNRIFEDICACHSAVLTS
jgi:DNA-binding NarL/FixJ family response regulator